MTTYEAGKIIKETKKEKKTEMELLSIENLKISFDMYEKGFQKKQIETVHSLSISVKEKEIVAIVGASGSGKSLLAHSILGILPSNASVEGTIKYCNETLTDTKRKQLLGREIGFIPQSVAYLDPMMKTKYQVQGVRGARQRQEQLFQTLGLQKKDGERYPHQLSGGMARRVMIASGIMEQPKLLIADEPTPGLSVDLAMETLQQFRNLADQGAGVLMITHDIDLAFQVADRIAVFYEGTILEVAPTKQFLQGEKGVSHPYTKALLRALPQNEFLGTSKEIVTGKCFGKRGKKLEEAV